MYYSQSNQDKWVAEFLEFKKNGYFIEVGAYDGIQTSNINPKNNFVFLLKKFTTRPNTSIVLNMNEVIILLYFSKLSIWFLSKLKLFIIFHIYN